MSSTPKHHIFPFFDLPRELRDWIYGLTFEGGPCSQLSVGHLEEEELQLKYKLRSENIREIIKILQISSRIRAEALHLLLKTKQKYSPLCRRPMDDADPGPSIYDIPTFLDVDSTQLVQLCLDQYEHDFNDYDEFYEYDDMPSARSVYPELMTSVFISSPFFPAVSPWGTDSMVQLASLPLAFPNVDEVYVDVSIRGLMACLGMHPATTIEPDDDTIETSCRDSACLLNWLHLDRGDLESMTMERIMEIPAMRKLADAVAHAGNLYLGIRECQHTSVFLLRCYNAKKGTKSGTLGNALHMKAGELVDFYDAMFEPELKID